MFEGLEGGPGTLIKYNPLSNVSSAEVWNFLRAMVTSPFVAACWQAYVFASDLICGTGVQYVAFACGGSIKSVQETGAHAGNQDPDPAAHVCLGAGSANKQAARARVRLHRVRALHQGCAAQPAGKGRPLVVGGTPHHLPPLPP